MEVLVSEQSTEMPCAAGDDTDTADRASKNLAAVALGRLGGLRAAGPEPRS